MSWIAAGTLVGGSLLTLKGQADQRVANNKATDANAKLQQQQNDQQWINWLMTRGVQPTQPIAAGTMPTAANSRAVNSRLPLWASVSPRTSAVPNQPFLIRKPGA